MKRLALRHLPILACAGFILVLFLANIWNFAVEREWPKLRLRSASPLSGLPVQKPTEWSFAGFLNGETQKAVSSSVGRNSPVFAISVRAKNQLIFSLFGKSPAPNVVIGRDQQLYERHYIEEFCRRAAVSADHDAIRAWATGMREMQDEIERAGPRFVFLISPSKAARLSESLPQDACGLDTAAIPDKITPYVDALTKAGVTFVDGARFMTTMRADYSMPLFPRGGTHWNMLAASVITQEILDKVPNAIGALSFDWRPTLAPIGPDRDLIDLLNLLRPDLSYPTPVVARAGPPGACAHTPQLVTLGTSFMNEVLIAATLAPCPPEEKYWFYVRMPDGGHQLSYYLREPGDIEFGVRQPVSEASMLEDLRNADLVILEENETIIGASPQFAGLLKMARRLRDENRRERSAPR